MGFLTFKMFMLAAMWSAMVQNVSGKTALACMRGNVNGSVRFKQCRSSIYVKGKISGLTPGSHGLHVHTVGSVGNNCLDAGSHFNPFNANHGARNARVRHVGDLGNIYANRRGVAVFSFRDTRIKFSGEANILNRTLVVHADRDDLGLGGNKGSLTTGNAGSRLNCAIIREI